MCPRLPAAVARTMGEEGLGLIPLAAAGAALAPALGKLFKKKKKNRDRGGRGAAPVHAPTAGAPEQVARQGGGRGMGRTLAAAAGGMAFGLLLGVVAGGRR